MSRSKLRYCLLALPALLTLVALTVPSEHLRALTLDTRSAPPSGGDFPCAAPAAEPGIPAVPGARRRGSGKQALSGLAKQAPAGNDRRVAAD
jgi:hypothetical protein